MDYNEIKLNRDVKFTGKIFDVFEDKALLPNGNVVSREVINHPNGVAVLAIDNDGFCYLVKQFRYPNSKCFLEIPAGIIERNEKPLDAAKRELVEETGFIASNYQYLGKYFVSPGCSKEAVFIFLATDLTKGSQNLDENELVDVVKLRFSDIVEQINNNILDDAKTVIAILKVKSDSIFN